MKGDKLCTKSIFQLLGVLFQKNPPQRRFSKGGLNTTIPYPFEDKQKTIHPSDEHGEKVADKSRRAAPLPA